MYLDIVISSYNKNDGSTIWRECHCREQSCLAVEPDPLLARRHCPSDPWKGCAARPV
jgi:hypothetical protein